jgi:O-antigen ligase/tetratricopeptide (TPR) repeat protein
MAWIVLLFHLTFSPLVFSRYTVDVFEENKVAWLTLTAILLLGIGASTWVSESRPTPSARQDSFRRRFGMSWRDPVLFAVLLCAASAIISTLNSLSPHTSWRGAADSSAGLWTVLGYLVLFLATRIVCRTVADGCRLLPAVAVGAAVSSLYAVLQVLHWDPLEWDGVSSFAGYVRPFATMAHPNLLGAYLVMAVPLVAAIAERAARQHRWFVVAVVALIGLLAVGVVILTLSRAAWLAAVSAFGVLLVAWWFAGSRRPVAILVATPLLGAVIAVGAAWSTPATGSELIRASLAERIGHLIDGAGRWQTWRASWEIFRDHPLSGSGLDTFRLSFGPKRPAEFWQLEGDASPTKAHNEFLHTLATQGLLGGVSLLALLAGLVVSIMRAWRRAQPEDRPVVAAVAASVAGFAVTSLFSFTVVGCGTLFVTCTALLSRWGISTDKVMSPSVVPARRATWGRFLTRISILGATAAGVVFGVVQPYLASTACYEADRLVRTDPRAALAVYERAVNRDPGNDRYWAKLSAAAQLVARSATSPEEQKHSLARAKQALDRAVVLEPADAYYHASLGRFFGELAYRRIADAAPCLREWDAALGADPRNATLLSEAARTAAALGDLDRVRTLASRGLSLYPRCGAMLAQLGACAFTSGCLSEAAVAYTEAVQADWGGDGEGQTRALASLTAVCLGLNQNDKALSCATEAIRREPEWATAHYLAGQTLERMQKNEEARKEFQRVLKLSPGHVGAAAALERLGTK